MKINRILAFLFCIVCSASLCSCGEKDTSSSSKAGGASSEAEPGTDDESSWSDIFSYRESKSNGDEEETTTVHITSEAVKEIASGITYADIIEQLGETESFGNPLFRQYIVDDAKLLTLNFSDMNAICSMSGEELLETAVSYSYPDGELPDPQFAGTGVVYGILVEFGDSLFFSTPDNSILSGARLWLDDASIAFSDGTPASEEDLAPMQGALVTYDSIAESYPPSIHCLSVVITK